MPRQAAVAVTNNFSKGLITEATGLNFPENACTETFDCEFPFDGSIQRRLGFDFEAASSAKAIDRSNSVVVSYLWRNVAGTGNLTVVAVQIGATVFFWKTSTVDSLSGGQISSTVTLTPVAGAPATAGVEAQFSDGNGFLFITHPYCEPMRVSYNTSTDVVTATNITIQIRDFEGAVADSLDIDVRPTSTLAALDDQHEYNLRNQGWTTAGLTAWDTAQTTMPSNADVMWRFKNATDDLDFSSASIARVTTGNTRAPNGHFILTLSDQNRDAAAGTTGVASTTTGGQRPSTSCFFAGRVFYAGINAVGFNSKIYFTQIVERTPQYGFCYQINDPTAEDLFDLLPSDGGVISIPEAGTVYKLVTVPGGITVFAANGVWFVTGSTGLGFTANDYTVQKIATIKTLTASSFVDVAGFPAFWNAEGIYIVSVEGNSGPQVKLMTYGTIQSFFDEIPLVSKRFAKGFYHPIEKKIQWLYRNTETTQLTETYEYDRVLNFNALTGSFYPWRITNSAVKVNSIIVTDSTTGSISTDQVIDGSANTVIDGSGNNVIVFSTNQETTNEPRSKFLVSSPSGGTFNITFAETRNINFLDWFQFDTIGLDFESHFITGYRLRGEGLRKFQSTWVKIFNRTTDFEDISYNIQGIWDYAITGSGTGRWSQLQYNRQTVTSLGDKYAVKTRRLKIRGHGIVLQFKVSSVTGQPFDIIGWSELNSGNQIP